MDFSRNMFCDAFLSLFFSFKQFYIAFIMRKTFYDIVHITSSKYSHFLIVAIIVENMNLIQM